MADRNAVTESKANNLILSDGERGLIIGQTGSGKTAFAAWMLRRIPRSPIVLYDTKDEQKFARLPNSRIVTTVKDAAEALDNGEIDYIIFRPSISILTSPEALDALLMQHYENWKGVDIYIDELYSFHNGGKAGDGLVALLTRGRSRGISTLMATQRPAWISRFCITEAQKLYVFKLVDKADKKRIGDVIPDFANMPDPPKHGFYFFESGDEQPTRFGPVRLDDGQDTGYVDTVASETDQVETPRFIWI